VMLGHIVEQNTTAYVLTYESPLSRQPGQHRIDVRVRRPGARVYARRGYFVEPPAPDATQDTALAPQTRLLRDTLLGSVSQGALPLAVHVAPRFANGRQGSATVTIRLDADVEGREAIDLLLATVDEDGRIANQRQVRMAPPPAGAPWEVTTDLSLPRGRHQLREAAITADASRTGLVLTPLEIIEPGRDLVMTPPVVLDTTDGRVHPTAVRRFVVGEPVGVQVEVGGRPVQQRAVTVRTSLVDTSGNSFRSADGMLDAGVKADRQRATAVLSTHGLGAGTYALLVEATEDEGRRVVRHAVPIELVGPPPAVTAAGAALVPHSSVARGPASLHESPGTFVIRTEQEWHTFWRQLPTGQAPPDIDFARVTLLAVVGEAGTTDPTVDTVNACRGNDRRPLARRTCARGARRLCGRQASASVRGGGPDRAPGDRHPIRAGHRCRAVRSFKGPVHQPIWCVWDRPQRHDTPRSRPFSRACRTRSTSPKDIRGDTPSAPVSSPSDWPRQQAWAKPTAPNSYTRRC